LQDERRAWVRYPCDRDAACRPAGPDDVPLPARLQTVSRGGVTLLVGRPFRRGEFLTLELAGQRFLVCVAHATAPSRDCWSVGGVFVRELGDDDLRPFEAHQVRPTADDRRAWVRFASVVQAFFGPADPSETSRWPATVLDISPT